MWPARSVRARGLRAVASLPAFPALEADTTVTPLILPMAQASALPAGQLDALTAWDLWSRFWEAGGQFMIVAAAAIVVVTTIAPASGRHMLDSRR
jgi:hypothetical protein